MRPSAWCATTPSSRTWAAPTALFVNGQHIARHQLSDRDRVVVAALHIDYLAGVGAAPPPAARLVPPTPAGSPQMGSIEVLYGTSGGKKLPLTKPVTTLGSPGVLVVVIQH